RGYRSYVVLTGCRMLYTLQHGDVATKPDATRWAKRELPDRWTPLIDWATAARLDARSGDMEYLDETLVFIRYVLERGRQARAKPDAARDK
ncbi:MAG: aminoglycoside adenylyltransferase domain-containing protein, partial [Chloroflexia bacterium]